MDLQIRISSQISLFRNPTNGFDNHAESMWLEKDVFLKLAGTDEARVFVTRWNDFHESYKESE